MNRFKWIPFLFLSLAFQFCSDSKSDENDDNFIIDEEEIVEEDSAISFYYGADLSYLNEMLDCGAIYKDEDNISKDPYKIFKEAGANLIRVRLWHNPTWTKYSNYEDVKKTIDLVRSQTSTPLGFHGHNNQQLAFANTQQTIIEGVNLLLQSTGLAFKNS